MNAFSDVLQALKEVVGDDTYSMMVDIHKKSLFAAPKPDNREEEKSDKISMINIQLGELKQLVTVPSKIEAAGMQKAVKDIESAK